jgi:site-specific DNA-methyltransferase (adenine-specific)
MKADEKRGVRKAFLAVRNGFPPDRVLADPNLNQAFIDLCRRQGLRNDDKDLNRGLMNLRKGGYLKGISKGKRTYFRNDEYRFACEIAVRFLEQREKTTLDRIICDPALRSEFDQIASQMAPGFTILEYRWAALSLRKGGRLRPEVVAHAVPATKVALGAVKEIDVTSIPTTQGLYVIFNPRKKQTLYVGETDNLRKRIEKHLDHSDNKGLAHWMWKFGQDDLHLEIHILPDTTPTRVRRARERELIVSRRPVFNVK